MPDTQTDHEIACVQSNPSDSPSGGPCPILEKYALVCPKCFHSGSGEQEVKRSQIRIGLPDLLENRVLEVCSVGQEYTVYRSSRGVYVQFSDCREIALQQRTRFVTIGPKLCQIRYLTSRMGLARLGLNGKMPAGYYNHQIVQAIVGTLECPGSKPDLDLLGSVLGMAISRVANENRVLYLVSCIGSALVSSVLAFFITRHFGPPAQPYFTAAVFGAIGAAFSIAMRIRSFELVPCRESIMAPENRPDDAWMYVAVIGLLGGFAERLVPNMLRSAGDKGEPIQKT